MQRTCAEDISLDTLTCLAKAYISKEHKGSLTHVTRQSIHSPTHKKRYVHLGFTPCCLCSRLHSASLLPRVEHFRECTVDEYLVWGRQYDQQAPVRPPAGIQLPTQESPTRTTYHARDQWTQVWNVVEDARGGSLFCVGRLPPKVASGEKLGFLVEKVCCDTVRQSGGSVALP